MSNFEWVAAFVLAVVSTGRIARLVTWDVFPPSAWFRSKFKGWTKDGHWSVLVDCGYCFGIWAGGAIVGWAALNMHYLGHIHWTWWVFNAWMAVSYLGAITMAYDGEDE